MRTNVGHSLRLCLLRLLQLSLLLLPINLLAADWSGQKQLSLDGSARYSLTPADSAEHDQWSTDYSALLRQPGQTLYFQIPISNTTTRSQTLWFAIPFPAIKQLRVTAGQDSWVTGDAVNFTTRPILGPDYIFPVYLPAGETTLIEGAMGGEILRFSFFLARPEVVSQQQRKDEFRDTFFFGTMATLIICCLLCFFATRSVAYLSFAAFSFSIAFLLFRVFGYGFEFIWPNFPAINDLTYILAVYATPMSGAWMINAMLSGENESDRRRFARTLRNLAIILGLLGLISGAFLSLQVTLLLPIAFSALILIVALLRIVIEVRHGSSEAKLLAAGLTPLTLGCAIMLVAAFEQLPWGSYIITTLMGCIALSCLLLAMFISLSLFRLLKKQRETELEKLKMQSAYAQKLEIDVTLRTQELQRSNEKLAELALKDPLTGLPNRRSLDIFIDQRCSRDTQSLAIALLDLDHFKKINDQYGHEVGDTVLTAVADTLKPLKTSDAIAGRFGGEEFAYISTNLSREAVQKQIDNIHQKISAITFEKYPKLSINVSVGWVMAKQNESIGESFRRADNALYHAKENGRNQIIEFPLQQAG